MQVVAETPKPETTSTEEPLPAETASAKATVEEAMTAKTADEPLPNTPTVLVRGKHTTGARPALITHRICIVATDVKLSCVICLQIHAAGV